MSFEDNTNCGAFVLNNTLIIAKRHWALEISNDGNILVSYAFHSGEGKLFTDLESAIKEFNSKQPRFIQISIGEVERLAKENNWSYQND